MGWTQPPTIIEEDNKACVDASILPRMTRNLRHLKITEIFLREKYAVGTCILVKVASGNYNADIGTKRVSRALFDKLTDNIIDKSLRVVNHKVNKTIMFTNKNQYISPQLYDGTVH